MRIAIVNSRFCVFTDDGINQEYQGSDGAVEGADSEGDSTKPLVP